MPVNHARKVLWVDDDIANLGSYVAALRSKGLDVSVAASSAKALELLAKISFDAIIADIYMPSPDGIELLRQAHPIQPQAALAVLSSFLYLQKYREQLRNLDFDVQPIDKDLPSIEDEMFYDRFVKPILDLVEKGVTDSLKQKINPRKNKIREKDPFSIEFGEFMRLPIIEKDKMTDLAEESARETIQQAFKEGKVWVLLCGDSNNIRSSAVDNDGIMPEQAILQYAMKLNRAPFHFFREIIAEDMWTHCGEEVSLKDYPTITLRLEDLTLGISNDDMNIHFDTGAPITFFSYEVLRSMNAIPASNIFGKIPRNGFDTADRGVYLDLSVFIKCQETGCTRKIKLRGRAIREWIESSYKRLCVEPCALPGVGYAERLCPERRGLIGRNILTDNGITLILDGARKKTSLKK
jgi:CheY-like chemotaxis protein